MLERLAQELPAFFGYYNVVFVAKAALATVALSAVGCRRRNGLGGLLLASSAADQSAGSHRCAGSRSFSPSCSDACRSW